MPYISRSQIVHAILLLLLAATSFSRTLAIQNSNETYMGYLTLTDCPPAQGVTPGGILLETLNASKVFQGVQFSDGVAFWGVVEWGLSLFANEQQLLQASGAQQLVYFNSSLESNFSTRQFILSWPLPDNNINFTFATAIVSELNRIQLRLGSTVITNFSQQVLQQLQTCLQPLQLSFLGGDSFLGLCPNSSLLVSFNLYSQGEEQCLNLQDNLQEEIIVAVATNPQLLLPVPASNQQWQAALLVGQGQSILFCNFEGSNMGCSDYQDDLAWMQAVASRAWGQQQSAQEQALATFKEMYPSIGGLSFPGTIVSIYSSQQIFYIESIYEESVYLAVLQEQQLLVNISLPGRVVYFGSESLVLQMADNSLLLAQLVLPYFSVDQDYQLPTLSLEETCSGATYSAEYQLLWTSLNYPSAFVNSLQPSQRLSSQGVFTYDLKLAFQVIGPAFEVFIENSSPLTMNLLQAPVLRVGQEIVALLEVDLLSNQALPQLSVLLYFLTRNGQLQVASPDGKPQQTIARNPCGFTSTVSARKHNGHYLIADDQGQLCLCQSLLRNCALQKIDFKAPDPQSRPLGVSMVYSARPEGLTDQLYGRLGVGQVINVYEDGVVSLQSISGGLLSEAAIQCRPNSTNALLFNRSYKDDLLIIFCEGDAYLQQYSIRGEKFLFNRVIPLYGFTSRPDGAFFAGTNYLYIEADLDPGYASPGLLPEGPLCCILRLDPSAYTVSVIAEIVEAQDIVFVETVMDLDVVYYNSSGIYEAEPFLKIYFPSTWISFSGSPICSTNSSSPPCAPITYSYMLTFASLPYNFAASFSETITFDLSGTAISGSPPPLAVSLSSSGIMRGVLEFNMSWVCGPVMSFEVRGGDEAGILYSLSSNSVVTRNKLVSLPSAVLQLIDLGQLIPDSTLASLILVITSDTLSLYSKFQQVWMQPEAELPTPNSNCYYYLYSVPDPFSAQFAYNCYDLGLPTALLTISYSNQSITHSLETPSYALLSNESQLRLVRSFPRPSSPPLLLGLQDGTVPSLDGALIYCQYECTPLQLQGQLETVLAYDAADVEGSMVVLALTAETLYLWLNPPPPTKNSSIQPSCIIPFQEKLGPCRSLSLLSVTQGSAFELDFLMECGDVYQQVSLSGCRTDSLEVVNSFAKFSDCDQGSRSQPAFTLANGRIELLAMECLHNIQTVLTQQFEAINASTSSITTAYLQVYAPTGPQCSGTVNPLRILSLAVSHPTSTHIIYSVGQQLKLLHQQVDGLVIDCFLDPSLRVEISLTQLIKQPQYPSLLLVLNNPHYQFTVPLSLQPPPSVPNLTAALLLEVIFLISNAVTLLSLLCWLIFRRNIAQRHPPQSSRIEINGFSSVNDCSEEPSQLQEQGRPSLPRTLRRVTEIQLFQPRYNQPKR